MTTPDDDLQAGEGVNEGSADATGESSEGTGVAGALAAASQTGRPKDEYDPAPPLDTGLTATDSPGQVGPGQEVEAGEG